MPYNHGLEVLPTDAAEMNDILYECVARAVTPFALRNRTVDLIAYPPRTLQDEQSVTLLVLVSVEDRPLPAHLDREKIVDGLDAAGIKAQTSLSRDSIDGQVGGVHFRIVIHKVSHSRGFDDVLVPGDEKLADEDTFEAWLAREKFSVLST